MQVEQRKHWRVKTKLDGQHGSECLLAESLNSFLNDQVQSR